MKSWYYCLCTIVNISLYCIMVLLHWIFLWILSVFIWNTAATTSLIFKHRCHHVINLHDINFRTVHDCPHIVKMSTIMNNLTDIFREVLSANTRNSRFFVLLKKCLACTLVIFVIFVLLLLIMGKMVDYWVNIDMTLLSEQLNHTSYILN